MKKINASLMLIFVLTTWSILCVAVLAQESFGCETGIETFDTFPIGWDEDVESSIRDDAPTSPPTNGNVRWALSNSDTYCGTNNWINDSGNSLCASSDNAGKQDDEDGKGYNAILHTPSFDTSNVESLTLKFNLHYQNLGGRDGLSIMMLLGDDTPVELANYTEDKAGEVSEFNSGFAPISLSVPLDKIGEQAQIVWRYYDIGGSFADWYVQIDDVQVICEFPEPMIPIEPIEDEYDVTGHISTTGVVVTGTEIVTSVETITNTDPMSTQVVTNTIVVTNSLLLTNTGITLQSVDVMTRTFSSSTLEDGTFVLPSDPNAFVPEGEYVISVTASTVEGEELPITVMPSMIMIPSNYQNIDSLYALTLTGGVTDAVVGSVTMTVTNRTKYLFLPFVNTQNQ